jgi:protein-disulfide isomerase
MNDKVDRALTIVLTVAALGMTSAFVAREFAGNRRSRPPQAAPTFVPDWKALVKSGVVVGSETAPAQLLEFMDFECPFCRHADSVIEVVSQRVGPSMTRIFLHYPLPNHRFAMPAARVAECALEQGRFAEARSLLFAKQDSFGLKSWMSFAIEAGVPDTLRFSRCAASSASIPRIAGGMEAGKIVGVRGTPTIVLNGWRFHIPPSVEELESAVRRVLDGKPVTETKANGASR